MQSKGLEGVVAAETALSQVNGQEGRLIYGGYEIEDLAANATFEEVCHLLWYGELPTKSQLEKLDAALKEGLVVDDRVIEIVRLAGADTHPMAVLRTAASALAFFDPDAEDMSPEANLRKSIRLTAQMVTLTAAVERSRRGDEVIKPRTDLSLAGNLLYMLDGKEPDAAATRIMDAALTLHAEHGMNASTFAARVTVGTLSDMHSAITSAIGTLKGPLHGGANEQVMEMLLEIGSADRAESWVRETLEQGNKVMGFGHRVYKTTDPRAPILKHLAEGLAGRGGDTKWLEISDRIQAVMKEEMEKRGKKIYPNVDFFSASVYYTLGIPMDLFTCIFAIARTAGWTAHVMEQLKDNRLIRPQSVYIGATDRKVVPLEKRG